MIDLTGLSVLIDIIGDLAAWLGLITGVVGTALGIRSSRKNIQLQREIVKIEENRDRLINIENLTAVLSVRFVRAHNAASQAPVHYIAITNSASSAAKTVQVRLEFFPERKSENHYVFPEAQNASAGVFHLVIPIVGGRSEYYIQLPWVAKSESETYGKTGQIEYYFTDVELRWINASGESSEYRHRLHSAVPPVGAVSAVAQWQRY